MEINPYSPDKVLCYYNNWLLVHKWFLGEGQLPFPITISVDPTSRCNMRCIGCNANKIICNNDTFLDISYLKRLALTCSKYEIKGVCLGGGGSPTMNPNLSMLVDEMYSYGIGVGMVTNGILLDKVEAVEKFDWIGVSVDASTSDTWGLVHGVKPIIFDRVLRNMESASRKGVQITYKYLIRPENVHEIYYAAQLAKTLGLFAFHARPMADPWFSKPSKKLFSLEDVESVKNQIIKAKKDFEDEHFQVHGIFSKVGKQFEVIHPFKKCWAIFATCVFQSNKKVGLCCDLRGCPMVEVGPFEDPMEFFEQFWGSQEHRNMQDRIDVSKCSRCTQTGINRIFEEAVIKNNFMIKFI